MGSCIICSQTLDVAEKPHSHICSLTMIHSLPHLAALIWCFHRCIPWFFPGVFPFLFPSCMIQLHCGQVFPLVFPQMFFHVSLLFSLINVPGEVYYNLCLSRILELCSCFIEPSYRG